MTSDGDGSGFGEGGQRRFVLDDANAFRSFMLDIYDNCCAMTDGALSQSSVADLDVFLFQPLAHGGPMTPGNAIVVDRAAAGLLRRGKVLISDDYIAYLPREDSAEPADAGSSSGRRLRLPDNVSLWPDRTMLSYHRSLFRAQ